MKFKIVADSSCNMLTFEGVDYATVPLKIVTDEREFVDDADLDTVEMMGFIESYKGRSTTSCPNVGEWLEAFGDAERVFTVAITSNLSGCHNAALQAKQVYEEQHPDRKVCCLDTLSVGPEMVLIIEKLRELIRQGLAFEKIQERIHGYMQKTHLMFTLESLNNMAKNGRVSPLIAKAVGFLNIRIVGKASDTGTLQQLHKVRGESKSLEGILREMKAAGYRGGKVRIGHSFNENGAKAMLKLIQEAYGEIDGGIMPFTGLCSFYGERGCVMVGFES